VREKFREERELKQNHAKVQEESDYSMKGTPAKATMQIQQWKEEISPGAKVKPRNTTTRLSKIGKSARSSNRIRLRKEPEQISIPSKGGDVGQEQSGCRIEKSYYHGCLPLVLKKWSGNEKNLFFEALQRYSKHSPKQIAASIVTKTPLQCIELLEELQIAFEQYSRKLNHY
jgi:hypothetical protein